MGGIALKSPHFGQGKRRRFVFDNRTCCYNVMSRVVGGDLLFGDVEKEAFRKLMRRMERFSGVEVLTYAVMGNHLHLLARVPEFYFSFYLADEGDAVGILTKSELVGSLLRRGRSRISRFFSFELQGAGHSQMVRVKLSSASTPTFWKTKNPSIR